MKTQKLNHLLARRNFAQGTVDEFRAAFRAFEQAQIEEIDLVARDIDALVKDGLPTAGSRHFRDQLLTQLKAAKDAWLALERLLLVHADEANRDLTSGLNAAKSEAAK